MAKIRLTDRGIKALKPADPGKRYDLMDSDVPGLGVRVTDKGQRTFVLLARYPGSSNPTRRAIGEYGVISLEQARQTARDWHELIRKGIDPKTAADRERAAELRRAGNTFETVAEDFLRLAVIGPHKDKPKQRQGHKVAQELRKEFVSRYGSRPVDSITSQDIVAVLDAAIERGAEYQAHNLLGHVRRMFNWAISRGTYGIDRSPCDRMRPTSLIGKKALRTRVLSDREIRALWASAGDLGFPYGTYIKMLLITGQRKSEVAAAEWSEFDLPRKLWTVPAERMKSNIAHAVPLTDMAMDLLSSIKRPTGAVHPFSASLGKHPLRGFGNIKYKLDKLMLQHLQKEAEAAGDDPDEAVLAPFVFHDIRRTVRTNLSALPVPDRVRELVIAHGRPGLHRVYDQWSYLDEKREALELWASRLSGILNPKPDNVVKLHA